MLRFDATTHTYTLGDAVLPSVTQVLRPLYDFSMVAPDVLERKRQIGTAVHKAIELDLAGDLDEASLSQDWAGYFKAWKAFMSDTGLTDADFGAIERPLHHPTYKFAGTPDLTLCMDRAWGVLDMKTTDDLHPAVALQTAAYRELENANTPKGQHKIERRYALCLRENRTYRLDEFKDRGDWSVFLAALTVFNWKRKSNGQSQ